MLVRSLRIPPSLLVLLVFLAFLGWQLSQGPRHEAAPLDFAGMGDAPPVEPVKEQPPRIAIITFVTDQRSYLHLSLKNHDHYARRHGYDFIVDYESHTDLSVVYYKFNMAERLVATGRYDWIWWLDFDTLITNTDIKLTDLITETLSNLTSTVGPNDNNNNNVNPDDIDYLFTRDCNGLNLGSYIFRGHERSLQLIRDATALAKLAENDDGNSINEQEAIVKLLKQDPHTLARTTLVPQQRMDAYPQEIACFDEHSTAWRKGDFVIHFAGAWAHVKGDDPTGQLMKKYESQIIWGDWKDFY